MITAMYKVRWAWKQQTTCHSEVDLLFMSTLLETLKLVFIVIKPQHSTDMKVDYWSTFTFTHWLNGKHFYLKQLVLETQTQLISVCVETDTYAATHKHTYWNIYGQWKAVMEDYMCKDATNLSQLSVWRIRHYTQISHEGERKDVLKQPKQPRFVELL